MGVCGRYVLRRNNKTNNLGKRFIIVEKRVKVIHSNFISSRKKLNVTQASRIRSCVYKLEDAVNHKETVS